jgi:hypothetical protein
MYLDRQHLSAKVGVTPVTLDAAFERMEEVGRAVRLTQDVLGRSGAELFIPEMHARRSVYFQASALAVLLKRPRKAAIAETVLDPRPPEASKAPLDSASPLTVAEPSADLPPSAQSDLSEGRTPKLSP